jgi:hypothetical protein
MTLSDFLFLMDIKTKSESELALCRKSISMLLGSCIVQRNNSHNEIIDCPLVIEFSQ